MPRFLRIWIQNKYFNIFYILFLLTAFTLLFCVLFILLEREHSYDLTKHYRSRCKAERERKTKRLLENVYKSFLIDHNVTGLDHEIRETIRDIDSCLRNYNKTRPHVFEYLDSLDLLVNIFMTVGYGDIAPYTSMGRLFAILFASIAIPLYMMFSMEVSEWMNYRITAFSFVVFRYFRYFILTIRGNKNRQLYIESESCVCELLVQMLMSGLIVILYVLFVSAVVSIGEATISKNNWGIAESAYYVFVSIALIGFGDMIGTRLLYLTIYLPCFFIGQVLLAVFYAKLVELFRRHLNLLRYGTGFPLETMLSGLSNESISKLEKTKAVLVKPIIANMSAAVVQPSEIERIISEPQSFPDNHSPSYSPDYRATVTQ